MIPISRTKIDDDLYLVLRTIYHYEMSIVNRYGLDFHQIYVLQYLRRNADARLTEIAENMELPMFAASRLVDRLAGEGYLRKVRDQADRRNLRIRLEPKGEEALGAIETASYERVTANLQDLSPQEVAQWVDVAERLHWVLGVSDKIIKPE